jgi:FdhD protein
VLQLSAEGVGRHNAVDKIAGRTLLAGSHPLSQSILLVSGRTSFELVQKALLAGIRLIAAVPAPSSRAIDLAQQASRYAASSAGGVSTFSRTRTGLLTEDR